MALARLARRKGGAAGDRSNAVRAVAALNALPARLAPMASGQIPWLAGLVWQPVRISKWITVLKALQPSSDRGRLEAAPELKWIFLAHGDGFLRQAALDRLDEPLPSPFMAALLACRLNDWVPQVRGAAARAAGRCFPATDPEIVAEAALFLLDRGRYWRRWGGEEAILEDMLLGRPDVADLVAERLARRAQGPLVRILTSALRRPAIDRHLPALAIGAVQPSVRAAAVEALAMGRARLPAGMERRWIDRPMGRTTSVPIYAERALAIAFPADVAIQAGLADRSSRVRKAALSVLIALARATPDQLAQVRRLAESGHRGVREKALFVLGQAGSAAIRQSSSVNEK